MPGLCLLLESSLTGVVELVVVILGVVDAPVAKEALSWQEIGLRRRQYQSGNNVTVTVNVIRCRFFSDSQPFTYLVTLSCSTETVRPVGMLQASHMKQDVLEIIKRTVVDMNNCGVVIVQSQDVTLS